MIYLLSVCAIYIHIYPIALRLISSLGEICISYLTKEITLLRLSMLGVAKILLLHICRESFFWEVVESLQC